MYVDSVISTVLRKNKLSAIIRRDKLVSFLVFEIIDFLDRDGIYNSLEVIHNDTSIFSKRLKFIGDGSPEQISDYLSSSIRKFPDRGEYLKNKRQLPNKYKLEQIFENYLHNMSSHIYQCCTTNFKVRGVEIYTRPTCMVFISFNFKGKRQDTLRIFLGQKTYLVEDYGSYAREYKDFISQVNNIIGGLVWV